MILVTVSEPAGYTPSPATHRQRTASPPLTIDDESMRSPTISGRVRVDHPTPPQASPGAYPTFSPPHRRQRITNTTDHQQQPSSRRLLDLADIVSPAAATDAATRAAASAATTNTRLLSAGTASDVYVPLIRAIVDHPYAPNVHTFNAKQRRRLNYVELFNLYWPAHVHINDAQTTPWQHVVNEYRHDFRTRGLNVHNVGIEPTTGYVHQNQQEFLLHSRHDNPIFPEDVENEKGASDLSYEFVEVVKQTATTVLNRWLLQDLAAEMVQTQTHEQKEGQQSQSYGRGRGRRRQL